MNATKNKLKTKFRNFTFLVITFDSFEPNKGIWYIHISKAMRDI